MMYVLSALFAYDMGLIPSHVFEYKGIRFYVLEGLLLLGIVKARCQEKTTKCEGSKHLHDVN